MKRKIKSLDDLELIGEQHQGIVFQQIRFGPQHLKLSSFKDCDFQGCDFSGITFEMTSFEEVHFDECKMNNLAFSDVTFLKTTFEKSLVRDCVFERYEAGDQKQLIWFDLSGLSATESDFSKSIFLKCKLDEAHFSECDLSEAIFDRCSLKQTNLATSKLNRSTFKECQISQTKLDFDGFLRFGESHGFVMGDG